MQIAAARLEQKYAVGAVLAQAVRQNTACGTRPDDDVVIVLCAGANDQPFPFTIQAA